MKIDLRTKQIKGTDKIKEYTLKKLSKLDKFTTRELEAKVVLKTEAKKAKAEVTIPVGHITIRAEVVDEDLLVAIDKCADKLERQIKNNKHKLVRSLQDRDGIGDIFKDTPETDKTMQSAVKIKEYKLEVMTFDEAVSRLELLDHSFFVYKNDKDHTCVVYLRRDNEYGLIETF